MATPAIRPLVADDLQAAADLLAALNPSTLPEAIRQRLTTVLADHPHYQVFGAFADDGKLVGVAGAWIATKIWCGKYLEIDNIVVDPSCRSAGIGSSLIRRLEELASENDCRIIVLDSYTANRPSHRLYHRLGYEIWGYHFAKPLGDWAGEHGP